MKLVTLTRRSPSSKRSMLTWRSNHYTLSIRLSFPNIRFLRHKRSAPFGRKKKLVIPLLPSKTRKMKKKLMQRAWKPKSCFKLQCSPQIMMQEGTPEKEFKRDCCEDKPKRRRDSKWRQRKGCRPSERLGKKPRRRQNKRNFKRFRESRYHLVNKIVVVWKPTLSIWTVYRQILGHPTNLSMSNQKTIKVDNLEEEIEIEFELELLL